MPVARKTTQTGTPPPPVSNGSILSRAVPVSQIKEVYQKVVLYGPNRTGKTSLACEWPKPLLLVSFEPGRTGGATSITKVPGVEIMQVREIADKMSTEQGKRVSPTDVSMLIAADLRGSNRYKTVVIDSASSLQEIILHELMGWTEEKTQLAFSGVSKEIYQERSEKTRDLLAPYLNLPTHTVVACHEKDHNPPKDERNKLVRGLQIESFIAPAIGGASVEWLQTNCGYICRLFIGKEVVTNMVPSGVKDSAGRDILEPQEIETGKSIRRLLCIPQPNFAAGFRSASPDAVPEWIDAKSPKAMYDKVQKVIRGEKI